MREREKESERVRKLYYVIYIIMYILNIKYKYTRIAKSGLKM